MLIWMGYVAFNRILLKTTQTYGVQMKTFKIRGSKLDFSLSIIQSSCNDSLNN